MEIKMKTVPQLIDIYGRIKTISLPIKTAYKFNKLFEAIKESNEFYRNEITKIIDQYAEKDENGVPKPTQDGAGISISPENVEITHRKIDELWNIDVDIQKNITFAIDELDGLNLTLEDLEILNPFIQDEE